MARPRNLKRSRGCPSPTSPSTLTDDFDNINMAQVRAIQPSKRTTRSPVRNHSFDNIVVAKPKILQPSSSLAVPGRLDQPIDDPSDDNSFNTLPIEIAQRIALEIEYDSDLCNFRLVCRSTHDAVDGDFDSFWRKRFLSIYERPAADWKGAEGNRQYKAAYQWRRCILKNTRKEAFKLGNGAMEKRCLEVLRDLIVDSFSAKKSSDLGYESSNLAIFKKFVVEHEIFGLFQPHMVPKPRPASRWNYGGDVETPSELLQTIQVLCAPLHFEGNASNFCCFPDSQKVVYGCKFLICRQNLIFILTWCNSGDRAPTLQRTPRCIGQHGLSQACFELLEVRNSFPPSLLPPQY
jgi:hypothetical protein